MIEKLQNNDPEIAKKIRAVFQASYAVEAKLLNALNFPPLQRPIESYIKSKNHFIGFLKNKELAGVIEIDQKKIHTHIQSLVVHPLFFRQGIARKLMEFTFISYASKVYMVETGVANEPACLLYKKLGFKEIKQWDTTYGIRKIRFERRMNEFQEIKESSD